MIYWVIEEVIKYGKFCFNFVDLLMGENSGNNLGGGMLVIKFE